MGVADDSRTRAGSHTRAIKCLEILRIALGTMDTAAIEQSIVLLAGGVFCLVGFLEPSLVLRKDIPIDINDSKRRKSLLIGGIILTAIGILFLFGGLTYTTPSTIIVPSSFP